MEPGIVVTTTGLHRAERDQVRTAVEAAGGRCVARSAPERGDNACARVLLLYSM